MYGFSKSLCNFWYKFNSGYQDLEAFWGKIQPECLKTFRPRTNRTPKALKNRMSDFKRDCKKFATIVAAYLRNPPNGWSDVQIDQSITSKVIFNLSSPASFGGNMFPKDTGSMEHLREFENMDCFQNRCHGNSSVDVVDISV
ncbi:hypothetical protein C5167_050459 [Papaver somniferum]|uniref:Uncharacterized protein n=1 Tax=Papaver somniferum TaxID=3469 RepID=A0A4Y7KS50_PAPSO|nr:hypothetical protein C5167_050459 [Papaver somniferum]